jgi:pyruvate dehydrogenase E2 component (dihydrolipoamide acetyltransferase)
VPEAAPEQSASLTVPTNKETHVPTDNVAPTNDVIIPLKKTVINATFSLPLDVQEHLTPAGPASRRLARELGVALETVKGSGRRGRILKQDVKDFAKQLIHKATLQQSVPNMSPDLPDLSSYGEVIRRDMNKIESVTCTNMQRAWDQIPHAWLQKNIDVTELEAGRKYNKSKVASLTMTAIIVKAIAHGLKKFPSFNSAIDNQQQQFILRNYIHIGVAVDTPKGLVIAVIRDVDQLNIARISEELNRLAEKARAGKLTPLEMKGAGITLSNLGGMGVDGLQPIVNWPEVAIVGVAACSRQPVYFDDEIRPRMIMPLTLGFDHRAINGADAARFLSYMEEMLNNPVYFLTQI